jgi:hypothetical protein
VAHLVTFHRKNKIRINSIYFAQLSHQQESSYMHTSWCHNFAKRIDFSLIVRFFVKPRVPFYSGFYESSGVSELR